MENVVQMPNPLERLAAKINAEHSAFCSGISNSVKHAIAAGELLIEAKGKVKHGEWLPWLAKNCSFMKTQAYLYISVAKNKAAVERQISGAAGNLNLNEVIALLNKIGAVGQDGELPSEPAKQKRKTPVVDRAREIVRPMVGGDKPISPRKLGKQHGISHNALDIAVAAERARTEALETVNEAAVAEAALAALPKTTKEKFELALKHALKRLEQEFEERVRQRSQENDERLWKPYYDEKLKLAEAVVAGRDGVFTKAEYNDILRCLHPDHVATLGAEWVGRHNDAFRLFREVEIKLLNEDESPQMNDRPWTLEDLDQRKAAVKAERAARRAERTTP